MVITQAPFRMSFFGGGTDFPAFYEEHGGKVISTSIDKYCYVHVRHLPPFFEYNNEITYSKREQVVSVDEIEHPAIREAMKFLDMRELTLTYDADLPARSGLGTSSIVLIWNGDFGTYPGMEQRDKTCEGVLEDVDKAERCAEVVEIIDKMSCKKQRRPVW